MSIDDLLQANRSRLARLTAQQAHAALSAGTALVDVRTIDQRSRDGRIPGALELSLNVLEWRLDPDSPSRDPRAPDLDAPVILLCNQGYCSSLAAARLQDLGFRQATDVIGGFESWRSAGLPVVREQGASGQRQEASGTGLEVEDLGVTAGVTPAARTESGTHVKLWHTGKVRDVYLDGSGEVLLVASDRVSVYDVVLPTPIPDKGKILTQLSLFWFQQLADVFPNHVISGTDVPAEWDGRAIRCQRLQMLPVEFIARGYLAGMGLREYQQHGAVSGVELPPGLVEGAKLPEPIFTPTTKATQGHDEFITFDEAMDEIGTETAEQLRDVTLEVYRRGAALAAQQGIIIADTKLEFGRAADGTLVLGDELLTSDSSRFWPADDWEPGRTQHALDKQFVRDWSSTLDWDRTPPGPPIPDDIIHATRQRYIDVYQRITGHRWSSTTNER